MKKIFLLCAAALLSGGLYAQAGLVGLMPDAASTAASSISVNVGNSGHVGYEGGTVPVEVTCGSTWTVDVYGVYLYMNGKPTTTTVSPDWARVEGHTGPYSANGNRTIRVYIDQEVISGAVDHIRHVELKFRNLTTNETCTGYIYQGM